LTWEGWFLAHYPLDERVHFKQLCGHVHEKWVQKGKIINVGVDVWNFTPHTIDEMLAKLLAVKILG